MDFEEFRAEIETKLNLDQRIELQEYHFEAHSFGSGLLAYRIKGANHKFVFDGRENELIWMIGKSHNKYFGAEWEEYKTFDGLEVGDQIIEEMKSF